MNTKIIKLDLNKSILYEKIKAKQGDTESRFLLFQLFDGALPFSLKNRSVRAYMIKPDSKEVFNDLIINDRIKGYCTLELTNQVLAAPGTVKIELMITEGTKKLTSSVFELEVDKSINSEKSIVSTNEFSALLNGLASLSEYDNYKNELNDARDGETNVGTNIRKIKSQLETLFQSVSNGKELLASAITDKGVTTLATDSFEVMANNIRKIANSGSEGGEPTTPITINHINDMTVTSGKVFNITYTTNVEAVRHEMSFNGGVSYEVIHPIGNKNGYSYKHEPLTETSYSHQRIVRVTDSNGNIATSNIFNITVSSDNTGGDTQPSPTYDIIPSQSSYTIKAGQDLLVSFTSSINISTCMLLFAPDFSNDYVGGYISKAGEFTFYTSSRSTGTYSVKIKGRRFNDSTQTYDDYYSDIFTLIIEDNTSGGGSEGGETITPITIENIDDITVNSGTTFDIVYTTNVDAVKHEMSFDGGSSYNVIYPSGDKNRYSYEHEALTETSYSHQRIVRVTDANNNTATSNTFNITVNSSGEIEDSNDITISQSSYSIQEGQDLKVSYTSSITLSSCMLLFGPNYTDNNYVGGYISAPGELTFYTSSKAPGNYTVKIKGRRFNDSTSSYDDYYSNEFTLVINASSSGEGGETITPITIGNINDMNVTSGKVFNITYTTNVDVVKHEMSFDGGKSYNIIHPSGDKNGYTYEHEALTETAYPHQRKIRVTDVNGNTATSNTFNITVSSDNTGGTQPSPSYDITIAQSSYTIKPGVDIKVNYTSSVTLSTCMLLYGPDFSETDGYSGGYISASNEFTFYTSSKPTGTYKVKVKGRVWNDSTSSYDDYYSNEFTIVIEDSASDGGNGGNGGSGGTTTPITIANISDITVKSGTVFNIIYTTNVDAVYHEMSFDGGSTFHVIHPTGDKYGYTYEHEAITETSYPHQRKIRVKDANGNVATSNTFNITVNSSSSGGGSGSTMSPFLASMYGDPRVIPSYPSGIQFPPINAHEDLIQPNGVNTTDSWKYGTRINQKPREDWTRVGFWGQVYRQEGYGYDPDNVAVEIKDCKLWGWNGSNWVLIHDVSLTSYNTSFYVESFAGDSNKAFPSNLKLNGKSAIAKFDSVNSGYMWHPYSGKARAGDYGLSQPYYYCSTMSARLVKWNESGADNLDSAKLCFNVGGDFWHTTHETWQPDWSANGEYAQGQFLKCTREWKTAYCTNVPESWGNGFPSL